MASELSTTSMGLSSHVLPEKKEKKDQELFEEEKKETDFEFLLLCSHKKNEKRCKSGNLQGDKCQYPTSMLIFIQTSDDCVHASAINENYKILITFMPTC